MRRAAVIAGSVCAAAVCAGLAFSQTTLLKDAKGDVCDFVATHAGKSVAPDPTLIRDAPRPEEFTGPFSGMLVETALADVDGDGDEELLHHMPEQGLRGQSPVVLGARDDWKRTGLDRGLSEDTRWADSSRWLHYGGGWHLIYFADSGLELADGVVTLTKSGATLACTFRRGFREEIIAYTGNPAELAACEARKNGPFINGIKGAPLTASDIVYLQTSPFNFRQSPEGDLYGHEIHIDVKSSVTKVDLDSDGKAERVVFMALDSGAGQGCGARFYELLPDVGKISPDQNKAQKLRDLQGTNWSLRFPAACGGAFELFAIEGKAYLHAYAPANSGSKREISRLRADLKVDGPVAGWPAVPVCQTRFVPEHVVKWRDSDGKPPN